MKRLARRSPWNNKDEKTPQSGGEKKGGLIILLWTGLGDKETEYGESQSKFSLSLSLSLSRLMRSETVCVNWQRDFNYVIEQVIQLKRKRLASNLNVYFSCSSAK